MKIEELRQLLADIRAGRQEDDSLDWKRAFWDLKKDASRREYLKDITAMANSMSHESVRRILLGVAPQGAISNSPMPADEATFQEVLGNITPKPTVSFEEHVIEGQTVTVVELHPPFDPPYAAKIGKEHHLWVRQGSSTTTASRYLLDEFYRRKAPRPTLCLSWLDSGEEVIEALPVPPLPSVDIESQIQRLISLRPTDAHLAEVSAHRQGILKLLRKVGPEPLGLGKTRSKPKDIIGWPEHLASDIDKALEVARTDAKDFRNRHNLANQRVSFRLQVLNAGSNPASNIVAYVRSQERLRILSLRELCEADLRVSDVQATRARRVVEIARFPERFESIHRGLAGLPFGDQDLSLLPPIGPFNRKVVEIDMENDSLRVDINCRLKHNFRQIIAPEYIYLVALLEPGETAVLDYECHADELPSPSEGQLTVSAQAVPGASVT